MKNILLSSVLLGHTLIYDFNLGPKGRILVNKPNNGLIKDSKVCLLKGKSDCSEIAVTSIVEDGDAITIIIEEGILESNTLQFKR